MKAGVLWKLKHMSLVRMGSTASILGNELGSLKREICFGKMNSGKRKDFRESKCFLHRNETIYKTRQIGFDCLQITGLCV